MSLVPPADLSACEFLCPDVLDMLRLSYRGLPQPVAGANPHLTNSPVFSWQEMSIAAFNPYFGPETFLRVGPPTLRSVMLQSQSPKVVLKQLPVARCSS